MKIFYCDQFVIPLPEWHRFPMTKYALLRQRIESQGLAGAYELSVPHAATPAEILRVHDPEYVQKVLGGTLSKQEVTRIGFPWSPQLAERSRRSSGATIEAAQSALVDGVAVNLAGGTHHAFADRGEGYCLLNDAAIAAMTVKHQRRVQRVAIVDADVHQGNGTAELMATQSEVFTLSIHGAKNYPLNKPPSDLDIPLEDGTGDHEYLTRFEEGLESVLVGFEPELIIYLAGADPYEGDRLGRMKLTKSGLAERDRFLLQKASRRRIPTAVVMAGGYAPEVEDIVEIHYQTVNLASKYQWGYQGEKAHSLSGY